jgi:ankyrin repeat protein
MAVVIASTLKDGFALANKRHQPYINFTNKVISISDLGSKEIQKEINLANIDSFYIRVNKLTLDDDLNKVIENLTSKGVRELFIFCNELDSKLSSKSLNEFISTYKIKINFKVSQITDVDLDAIRADKIGNSNLLGFKKIEDFKLKYASGLEIPLLNNKESNDLINANYISYKKDLADKYFFKVADPNYIISDNQDSLEKRNKVPTKAIKQKLSISAEAQQNLDQNIDLSLNLDLDIDLEEEDELDIDAEQLEKKLKQHEALQQIEHLFKNFSYETDVSSLRVASRYVPDIVNKIFNSDNKIKFVTQKALELIARHPCHFNAGINLENVPVGLAFKDGIIFASDKRLKSMPINDFTIKLDTFEPNLAHPLTFTWLHFASKASIELNDIYRTESAPALKGKDEHPGKEGYLSDDHLDKPNTLIYSRYNKYMDLLGKESISFNVQSNDYDKFVDSAFFEKTEYKFMGAVEFKTLSKNDIKRLKEIEQEFKKRDLHKEFESIIKSHPIKQSDFLLEESATIFFAKLFKTILPLSKDKTKQNFFKAALKNLNNNSTKNLYIEDVFEGLNGLYSKLQELLMNHKITNQIEKNELLSFLLKIFINQSNHANNFKSVSDRIISIIDYINKNGGNLSEQIEYLNQDGNRQLIQDPIHFTKAKDLNLNTIHESLKLNSNVEYGHKVLEQNEFFDKSLNNFSLLVGGLRYLAAIPAFKRPSIDTYSKYLCFKETKQYLAVNVLAYKYKIYQSTSPINVDYNEIAIVVREDKSYFLTTSLGEVDSSEVNAYVHSKILAWIESAIKKDHILLSPEKIQDTIFFKKFSQKAYKDVYNELLSSSAINGKVDAKLLKVNLLISEIGIEREIVKEWGVTSLDNNDLVKNYTSKQNLNNIKLFILNILTSTGEHYDKTLPDGEFQSYASLFNILFTSVKPDELVKIGGGDYDIKENYNTDSVDFSIKKFVTGITDNDIISKEIKHERLTNNFIKIYKKNPEFNFAQVVVLGLIESYQIGNKDEFINYSEELVEYNQSFTHFLRVLLSTKSKGSKDSAEELELRTKNIASKIKFLFTEINHDNGKIVLHKYITNNGASPENLILFAACLGREEKLDYKQAYTLIDLIAKLDANLKWSFVESIESTKLPFAQGKIIEDNSFPIISLDILSNNEQLLAAIESFKAQFKSYENETKFNSINDYSSQFIKINFAKIEKKYNIEFSKKLHEQTYKYLKENIVRNDNFISSNVKYKAYFSAVDKKVISEIERDIAEIILQNLSSRDGDWIEQNKKIINIIYNPDQSLSSQFLKLEFYKKEFDGFLNNHVDSTEKKQVLSRLEASKIPVDSLLKALNYLITLDGNKLQEKNITIGKIFLTVSDKLITDNFYFYKLIIDHYLHAKWSVTFDKYYSFFEEKVNFKENIHLIKLLLDYCNSNNDHSALALLHNLNDKVDNTADIINWIISLSPSDIYRLNSNSNFNLTKAFELNDIKKIEVICSIALKFGKLLNSSQYDALLNKISKNDVSYAIEVKSLICAPKSKGLTSSFIKKTVFNNLDDLDKAKAIYSQHNLARFEYNLERVINKINQINHKFGGDIEENTLFSSEQNEMLKSFVTVMQRAKIAADYTITEIRERVTELKHSRIANSISSKENLLNMDLEYISLSFEALYRETGKFPRDTQILSVLLVAVSRNHIIEEIATGQGKSIIGALQAAYLWYVGNTVDVVSSSRYLAEEGIKEFSPFYNTLGIEHSKHIIKTNSEINEYKKGGVNYAYAPDLALFRADREFYSYKNDLSLNADVSIICDEVDAMLTSDVNYKLAVPLINTTQDETRVLFEYILQFSQADIFNNKNTTRKDDIANLKLFLSHQFSKENASYVFPLKLMQLRELESSISNISKKLLLLHKALIKCDKNSDVLFDKFLDSVTIAKSLERGIDYVILDKDADDKNKLIKATPIIKDQPSKDTVFGDGVQAFLHLLIEKQHPDLVGRFDLSPPTATIFNVSPKSFFDYYHITGGRIIGITGTAGDRQEIEEFRLINKINSYSIPKFEEDKKRIVVKEAANSDEQFQFMVAAILAEDSDRPILIFCENTKKAESVYEKLINLPDVSDVRKYIQLYASSPYDTDSVGEVKANAGKKGVLTITTPMLGRGIDYILSCSKWFLEINLCTSVTLSALKQMYGRVARNGDAGDVLSIFNKEEYSESVEDLMLKISSEQSEARTRTQPLTDILKFMGTTNKDNIINAILVNDFITNSWNVILQRNNKLSDKDKKSNFELRKELIAIVKHEYPHHTKNIDSFINNIDYNPSDSISISDGDNSTLALPEANNIKPYDKYSISGTIKYKSRAIADEAIDHKKDLSKLTEATSTLLSYTPQLLEIYRCKPISDFPLPTESGQYQINYNYLYNEQIVVMLTHAFSLEKEKINTHFILNYNRLDDSNKVGNFIGDIFSYIPSFSAPKSIDFVVNGEVLYAKFARDKIKLSVGYNSQEGIPLKLYSKIKDNKPGELKLSHIDEHIIFSVLHANKAQAYNAVEGEGSMCELMLSEFKKSFAQYQSFVKGKNVDGIEDIVESLVSMHNLNTKQFANNKYIAISFVTEVSSTGSHAESFLTNGKFLFWINRGSESGDIPGIKLFYIKKDIMEFEQLLNSLRTSKSQTKTREAVYKFLREEDEGYIPQHVPIAMPPQTVGNCGWAQKESIFFAAFIAKSITHLEALPIIESQEWQKALKDAWVLYKDFLAFDKINRLESINYLLDSSYSTFFLSNAQKVELDVVRNFTKLNFSHDLLKVLNENIDKDQEEFSSTIYEQQFKIVKDNLVIEEMLISPIGLTLQYEINYNRAKHLLKSYIKYNPAASLERIYNLIKTSQIKDTAMQLKVLIAILSSIAKYQYAIIDLEGSLEAINLAISNHSFKDEFNFSAFQYDIFKYFLNNDAESNSYKAVLDDPSIHEIARIDQYIGQVALGKESPFGLSAVHLNWLITHNHTSAEILLKKGYGIALQSGFDNKDALQIAIEDANVSGIKLLKKYKVNAEDTIIDDMNAISWVVYNKMFSIAKELIKDGSDINNKYINNYSLVTWAIKEKESEFFEYLIQHGADLNQKDKNGNTPLMEAMQSNYIRALNILISAHDEASLTSFNKQYSLANAFSKLSPDNKEKLIKAGYNWLTTSELFELIDTKKKDLFCLYIKYQIDHDHFIDGIDAKTWLVKYNFISSVVDFIKQGYDFRNVNIDDNDLVLHSMINNQMDLLEALLQHGVDFDLINQNNGLVLTQAIATGNPDIFKLVLRHIKNIDDNEHIKNVIKSEQYSLIQTILESGYKNINSDQAIKYLRDEQHDLFDFYLKNIINTHAKFELWNPVGWLIYNKYDNHAKTLIEKGYDFAKENMKGDSVLVFLIKEKNYEFIEYLFSKGMSTNDYRNDSKHPLTIAYKNNDIEAFRLLLKYKIEIPYGNFLSDLVRNNSVTFVKELVKFGYKASSIEVLSYIIKNLDSTDLYSYIKESYSLFDRIDYVKYAVIDTLTKAGKDDLIKILLEKETNYNTEVRDDSLLVFLTRNKLIVSMEYLLIKGVNVDYMNKWYSGESALTIACKMNFSQGITLLVKHHANVLSSRCFKGLDEQYSQSDKQNLLAVLKGGNIEWVDDKQMYHNAKELIKNAPELLAIYKSDLAAANSKHISWIEYLKTWVLGSNPDELETPLVTEL